MKVKCNELLHALMARVLEKTFLKKRVCYLLIGPATNNGVDLYILKRIRNGGQVASYKFPV
jgi:hypothetical protein